MEMASVEAVVEVAVAMGQTVAEMMGVVVAMEGLDLAAAAVAARGATVELEAGCSVKGETVEEVACSIGHTRDKHSLHIWLPSS